MGHQEAQADTVTRVADGLPFRRESVRHGRPASRVHEAGLYILISPSGEIYVGMSGFIALRIAGHAISHQGADSNPYRLEREEHDWDKWCACIAATSSVSPTALHALEIILNVITDAFKSLNRNVFDNRFYRRSAVPGRQAIDFGLTSVIHVLRLLFTLRKERDEGIRVAACGSERWASLGLRLGNPLKPSTLSGLAFGHDRKDATRALLLYLGFSRDDFEGLGPEWLEVGGDRRVKKPKVSLVEDGETARVRGALRYSNRRPAGGNNDFDLNL